MVKIPGILVGALALTGCAGESGAPAGLPGVADAGGAGDPAPAESCGDAPAFAEPRIWRLTDEQYANVVRDVFGLAIDGEVSGARAEAADGITLAEVLSVNDTTATNYQISAHRIALQAVTDLPALLGCSSPDAACIDEFIRAKIPRAFRRPLEDGEISDLEALYQSALEDGPAVGVRLVLEEVLQSPFFIWRTELGGGISSAATKTSAVGLTPYEIASAMSFFLADSAPDDTLWSKAEAGTLAEPDVLAAEADRLMALPEVKANLWKKAGAWIGIGKTQEIHKEAYFFPDFTPTVKAALAESAELFLTDVVSHGGLADLMNSRRVYVNEELGKLYGIPGATGPELVPIEASDERGAGIFTQPAFLAAYSRPSRGDPIHRGLFIYRSFICGAPVPPPTPAFLAKAATFPAGSTERQLAELRAADGVCAGCHGLFDPLGLLTERYDPIGRYSETDKDGQAIDDTATVRGLGADVDGKMSGIADLVSRLRSTRRVADCASDRLATAVLGKETRSDASCVMKAVRDTFAKSGSFNELFRAIVTSSGFVTRDPVRESDEP